MYKNIVSEDRAIPPDPLDFPDIFHEETEMVRLAPLKGLLVLGPVGQQDLFTRAVTAVDCQVHLGIRSCQFFLPRYHFYIISCKQVHTLLLSY